MKPSVQVLFTLAGAAAGATAGAFVSDKPAVYVPAAAIGAYIVGALLEARGALAEARSTSVYDKLPLAPTRTVEITEVRPLEYYCEAQGPGHPGDHLRGVELPDLCFNTGEADQHGGRCFQGEDEVEIVRCHCGARARRRPL